MLRDALLRVIPAITLCAATASAVGAQYGAAFGIRSVSGAEYSAANSERRGLEFRGTWDGDVSTTFGWRAEVSLAQMQFQRDDGTRRFKVSENSFEFAAVARASVVNGSLTGLYALIGPTFATRALCGADGQFSSNGRVACDEGDTQSLGYQVGAGYASRISAARELMFELRYLDGVIAGAGNPVVAITIGLRRR